MIHLRYDLQGAHLAKENRHPQVVMRELNIVYENAIPQSLGDQWWFFNCIFESDLPEFLEEMKADNWLVNQYRLPKEYANK